jgi:hypothetical protein
MVMKRGSIQSLAIAVLLLGASADASLAEEARPAKAAQSPVFLPFEFYSRHRALLGLNEVQAREMQRIAEGVGENTQKLESERRKQTALLEELIAKSPIDVEEAMRRFQGVLAAENELKALQFRSGLIMRNALRPEQLKHVQHLANQEGSSRGAGVRAEFGERLERLKAEIHKRSSGSPSPEVVEQIKKIEQAAKEGRFSEAKTQLEQVLRDIRGDAEKASPLTTPQQSQ